MDLEDSETPLAVGTCINCDKPIWIWDDNPNEWVHRSGLRSCSPFIFNQFAEPVTITDEEHN